MLNGMSKGCRADPNGFQHIDAFGVQKSTARKDFTNCLVLFKWRLGPTPVVFLAAQTIHCVDDCS